VIVTIMLNFIVLALLNWIVSAKLHLPETLRTPDIARACPRLADACSDVPRQRGQLHHRALR
jgi:general nucleoside transport system permease protein